MGKRKTATPEAGALATALVHAPWAITAAGKEMLRRAALTPLPDPAAIEELRGARYGESSNLTIRDGIATIRVTGPLFRRENIFTWWFGWATYESLARDVAAARKDPKVRRLLYDWDSPGGEVNGLAETARLLFAGRDEKEQAGYASGLCCSAAYWLASAVGELRANEAAILGSIGVMTTFYDDTEFLKQIGFARHDVRATQSPKKNLDPTEREGRAALQKTIDDLAEVMIASIATFRGVTAEQVIERYGQGAVFVGAAAVEAGLADDLTTYEQLHAELAQQDASEAITAAGSIAAARPKANGRPTAKEETMAKVKGTAAGGAPAPVAEEEEQDEDEQAGKKKTEEDEERDEEANEDEDDEDEKEEESASVANQVKQAMADERKRVRGIMALQRTPAQKQIIDACIDDPSCGVEQAAHKLYLAESGKGPSRITALKKDEERTPAPSNTPGASEEQNQVEALSDRIANVGKKQPAAAAS